MKRIKAALCCLLLWCLWYAACADGTLSFSLPETVKGFTPCEIRIVSPADGEAELHLFDRLNNPWLTLRHAVAAGENLIPWDGLGANEERLLAGPYHFDLTVHTADGAELTASASFEINGTTPTLVYALPSSESLYLDHKEKWFVECYTCADCLVAMEVKNLEGETVFYKETEFKNDDGTVLSWNGTMNNLKKAPPGDYTVTFWSKLNQDRKITVPLRIEKTYPYSKEIKETGPVIPERGMSDEEIWEIMMKPSVVIRSNGTFQRYPLKKLARSSSSDVASLRGATQGLEVIGVQGNWAHVRAWDHENGQPAEGYLLHKKLTVFYPAPHYGVLIDKREQTLTVYEDGKPLGTVPVSTGLAIPGNLYRETPAGAFLTDVHIGPSFAQDGYRYEYPLRYDAGNMIHGVGYERLGSVRDYSDNLPLLGQKASHGCTRVSLFTYGDCPITMYWLWTHLPYHTRVIILDD